MIVNFPSDKFKCLFSDKRYIVLYGGRGAAKSWSIARALLIRGTQKPMLILCAREVQKSIQDSVHRLLSAQIIDMGLQDFYEIQQARIIGRNGTEFVFAGLRHNINSIKSFEGADVVWVEEAQSTSKHSWDVLIPTIRKEGSQIIVSYNPDLEDDDTHQRFVINSPPDSHVEKVGWQDNKHFPAVLKMEMESLKERDYQAYMNVWEGHCRRTVEGAVFSDELDRIEDSGRITRIVPKEGVPVHTFWDLGQSDNTAIWFMQQIGMEYWLIDYYQNNAHKMPHYLRILAERGYLYGTHYLPHDAAHDQLAAGSTIEAQVRDALRDNHKLGDGVKIVPRITKKALAIDAARNIMDRCIFDKDNTDEGIKCLRRYRYAQNLETGKVSKEPVHDIWSHGTDAFLTMAQHYVKPQHIDYQDLYYS